jgi:uncharacterized membrane protein
MRPARAVVALFLFAACARGADRSRDTAVAGETESDVITDADTLGPSPEVPTFQLIGTPVDMAGERFARSTPVMVGDTLRWNSLDSAGRALEAIVVEARCSDGMSDKVWSHRARVVIGREQYDGCAERRRP